MIVGIMGKGMQWIRGVLVLVGTALSAADLGATMRDIAVSRIGATAIPGKGTSYTDFA